MAAVGVGLAFAYSTVLTRTLATVRQQDAADASGVLVTSAQLGLLTGVAVFGAVFLGYRGQGGQRGAGRRGLRGRPVGDLRRFGRGRAVRSADESGETCEASPLTWASSHGRIGTAGGGWGR